MASRLGSFAQLGRHLGPRSRKVIRYAGFVVLALVTFVFAFQLTFPVDRVKDKAIEALADKYDVAIGDVDRSIIPGRIYFHSVSITTRPVKASDVPTRFHMDELEVDLGILAAIRGTLVVNLDARIQAGRIVGKIALASSGTQVHFVGEDLPSIHLPVREALGLPMSGNVRFKFDLDLPNDKAKTGKAAPNWAKANGGAEFACPSGCTFGDGKSKLKLTAKDQRQQALLDESGGGIDFGKVNVDSIYANLELKQGKLEITRFETKSNDGELHIALNMVFNQDINASQVTGCLRFRGSDALLKREPKTHAAFSTTGGPLGPDNLFHIKLDGQLRNVRRLPLVCGSNAGDGSSGSTARPNLTVPPEAPKPGLGAVSAPPPVVPTPAPAYPPPAGAPGGSGDHPAGPPPVPPPAQGSAPPIQTEPMQPPPPPGGAGP